MTADEILGKLAVQERALQEALHRMVIVQASQSPDHLNSVLEILDQLSSTDTAAIRSSGDFKTQVKQTMQLIGDLFEGTLIAKGMLEQAKKENRPIEPILMKLGIPTES